MNRRRFNGALFLALAALLAWGGTVDPGRTAGRWIVVAALVGWSAFSLFSKGRHLEQAYVHMLAIGLTAGAVGWLIPGSGSRALMMMGAVIVLISAGLLIWSWIHRREAPHDDTDRPG